MSDDLLALPESLDPSTRMAEPLRGAVRGAHNRTGWRGRRVAADRMPAALCWSASRAALLSGPRPCGADPVGLRAGLRRGAGRTVLRSQVLLLPPGLCAMGVDAGTSPTAADTHLLSLHGSFRGGDRRLEDHPMVRRIRSVGPPPSRCRRTPPAAHLVLPDRTTVRSPHGAAAEACAGRLWRGRSAPASQLRHGRGPRAEDPRRPRLLRAIRLCEDDRWTESIRVHPRSFRPRQQQRSCDVRRRSRIGGTEKAGLLCRLYVPKCVGELTAAIRQFDLRGGG